MEIKDALLEVEKELGISPPLGGNDLSPRSRFQHVLIAIRGYVCEQKETIKAKLNSDGGSLALVVGDVLMTAVSGVPVPMITISSRIAKVGLDLFCADPGVILDDES